MKKGKKKDNSWNKGSIKLEKKVKKVGEKRTKGMKQHKHKKHKDTDTVYKYTLWYIVDFDHLFIQS